MGNMDDSPIAGSISNAKFAWSVEDDPVSEIGRRGETEKGPESPHSRVA